MTREAVLLRSVHRDVRDEVLLFCLDVEWGFIHAGHMGLDLHCGSHVTRKEDKLPPGRIRNPSKPPVASLRDMSTKSGCNRIPRSRNTDVGDLAVVQNLINARATHCTRLRFNARQCEFERSLPLASMVVSVHTAPKCASGCAIESTGGRREPRC